jgi:hypothetical protein
MGHIILRTMCGVLLLLFSLSAHAQWWGGCIDARGIPVLDIQDPSTNDIAVSRLAPNGAPVILYNPFVVLSSSNVTRRFFYFHECGHHALGHVLGNYIPLVSEQEADCWAARTLVARGEFTLNDLRQVQMEISSSPGDWSHLPGPQRAMNLIALCMGGTDGGSTNSSASRPTRNLRTGITWDQCYDSCKEKQDTCDENRCSHLDGDAWDRCNDRCQSAMDRCTARCPPPSDDD